MGFLPMNLLRLGGDGCHLLSFLVMFWKLFSSQNVSGISLKTQELYALVFMCRYVDIFWNFFSIYNEIMKIIFLISSFAIVYIIRFASPHSDTYEKEDDYFPSQYVVIPSGMLAIAINKERSSPFEVIWAFSIYLEAVAILPQLFMLQKQGGAESITSNYVALLGLYRLFYIGNWVHRYFTEPDYFEPIVWVSGVVQSLIYLDFFYNYVTAKGKKGVFAPIELDAA